MNLDAGTLCCSDATCRLLRALNRANAGPWRALGSRTFYGMELEREGIFESAEETALTPAESGRKHARVDWKGRYVHFKNEVPTFRDPFRGGQIKTIRNPDDVAYCKCRIRSDFLNDSQRGVYLEVEVLSNPDNLSLAVVDFESGGRSSVTFSPDTGAVIREKKLRESPRKVQGAYIQPLATTKPGRKFEGVVGVYIFSGRLAFFRRCIIHNDEQDAQSEVPLKEETREMGPWECTGFITDLSWAEGRRLTPCLAFRDEGAYKVRVARLCSDPPQFPTWSQAAIDGHSWSALNWEADSATMGD
mmetsp:Transcript_12273/g.23211  ORF Transcript_12273/g.23211 Transcript_12273/m.23211 type:complete len:303 (-) Transcript_12273:103-1011(-)